MSNESSEITVLLGKVRHGDKAAEQELMQAVYRELRRIASRCMRTERAEHTLEPTALVNEAYLRLAGNRAIEWQNRAHFFAVSASVMRRILIDYARARGSEKRGGEQERVDYEGLIAARAVPPHVWIAVHEALERLAEFDPRQSKVVELRFFGGLTDEEVAEVLSVSTRTVKRDWSIAKAWLYAQLS